MIKIIELIKRRPDLTREQFIDYYENHHAPLTVKLFGTPDLYQRNYVRPDRTVGSVGFDVVTELAFRDQKAFDAFNLNQQKPELAAIIREDQKRYRDDDIRSFFVDVSKS